MFDPSLLDQHQRDRLEWYMQQPAGLSMISGTQRKTAYIRGAVVYDTGIVEPKGIPSKKQFQYNALSEGQFNLMLLREVVKLKKAQYADPLRIYDKGLSLIDTALISGLHRQPKSFTGSIPSELNGIAQSIVTAIGNAQSSIAANPAAQSFVPSINGSKIGMGFDPENPQLPTVDCNAILNSTTILSNTEATQQAYEKCLDEQLYVSILNESYAESGHHLLLAVIDETLDRGLRRGLKQEQQKTILNNISRQSGVSIANLKQWASLGVMRENVNKGTAPFEPLETLTALALNYENRKAKVGAVITAAVISAFIKALPAIIAAIASATIAIVNVVNNNKLKVAQQSILNSGVPSIRDIAIEWDKDLDGYLSASEIQQAIASGQLPPGAVLTPGVIPGAGGTGGTGGGAGIDTNTLLLIAALLGGGFLLSK